MTYRYRGKRIQLRPYNRLKPKLDMKTLKFLMPLAEELRELATKGPDELEKMGNIVTEGLSKRKSLLDITDEEVDLYLTSLVEGEV